MDFGLAIHINSIDKLAGNFQSIYWQVSFWKWCVIHLTPPLLGTPLPFSYSHCSQLLSQIEQLEEVHKSEDAELEKMKEEFTKRIGESDGKLQVAAKVKHTAIQ